MTREVLYKQFEQFRKWDVEEQFKQRKEILRAIEELWALPNLGVDDFERCLDGIVVLPEADFVMYEAIRRQIATDSTGR